jgi:hypothetical protein
VRVYVIGRNCQATEIDVTEAARRFAAWLADPANPALTEVIQTWLWSPADAGGLGALAESLADITRLRANITVTPRPGADTGEVR